MEFNFLIYIIFPLLVFITTKLLLFSQKTFKKLPPNLPSLPIIGNLHQIKLPIHHYFHNLSQKYGPIFTLKFGSRLVAVVSSPSLAEECFTKNDIVFANRVQSLKTKYLAFNSTNVISSSYGDHWRNLRRICSIEILSNHRLNSFSDIRKDETMRLIQKLAENSQKDFAKVELRTLFSELTFNIIMRMVCGKRFYGDESDEAKKFRDIMNEIQQFGLGSKLGEFVPLFRFFDFSGHEKNLKKVGEKMDALFQGLVDEHRRDGNENKNTMIDHLLSLQQSQPDYYSDQIIKGLIMALIVAGTETSAITLEWAMANLLNHPEILEKAKIELENHIGQESLIEEGEATKLQYLQNIISETLRLHPAAPMLLPHVSLEDCTVGGFDVPRNTMLMVNAWAIHRDSDLWADPSSFKPERFESNRQADMHGFMPFGMGRRACPGSGLALRTLGLTLGSLIQCFEWKRIGEEEVDMSEGRGTLVPMAVPLEAQCKARPIINQMFS
ncbi:cytochrome P450 81E8-like [Vicia villosa]|uniref:cytochrome P450 81E8-like n=1 Tax=Vicia villosa TaxID=3911 RepID=UPI00273B7FB7|nr:cytochrome P450 81E8-like [Vicia villosa]